MPCAGYSLAYVIAVALPYVIYIIHEYLFEPAYLRYDIATFTESAEREVVMATPLHYYGVERRERRKI